MTPNLAPPASRVYSVVDWRAAFVARRGRGGIAIADGLRPLGATLLRGTAP